MGSPFFLQPDWPAPSHVKSLVSTRKGGVSNAPYERFNLGDHVGDDPDAVMKNRQILAMSLPQSPMWLTQTHSTTVVKSSEYLGLCEADASYTNEANIVSVVMTADCLPVLFCDDKGSQVAAAHAGWRGLLDGILEQTVACFSESSTILAWLGPAIGPDAFEVGQEVKDMFCQKHPQVEGCFKPSKQQGKWLADLYGLARYRLQAIGVTQVYGGEFCTFYEAGRFFSYRRDGVTGRMASCIWLEQSSVSN